MIPQHYYPDYNETKRLTQTQKSDDPKHGSPPDDCLEQGPIQSRGCTDILICLIFLFSFIAMCVIAVIGIKEGQPLRLTYPYDPDDKACGHDSPVEDYPYIYLVTPFPGFYNRYSITSKQRTTCLKNCPIYQENEKPTRLNCSNNSFVKSCDEFLNLSTEQLSQLSKETITYEYFLKDSVIIYNTTELFGRFCVPSAEPYASQVTSALNLNMLQEWVSDLQQTWMVILAAVFVAYLVGFIYMGLMRYLSGCMVWITIILYFLLIIFIGYFCFEKSQEQKKQMKVSCKMKKMNTQNHQRFYQVLRFSFGFLQLYRFYFLCNDQIHIFRCNFNRIRLSIAIIKSAAVFTKDVPTSLLVPILMGLVMITFWAFWVAQFIHVFAVGDITGSDTTPFATIKWNQKIRYLSDFYKHKDIWLWCSALINAITEYILASSCVFWYFSQNNGIPLSLPVFTSVKRALFNHLGSLAFGSFLLAAIKLLKFWLEYIQKSQPDGVNKQQPIKCFLDCLKCYVECFERFIEFINKQAYIQIALTGKSFCPAAKDAIYLIKKFAGQQAIVIGMGHIFSNIGKYFIALITTLLGYFVVTYHSYFKGKLFSPFFPVLFVFIISSLIGHVFMVVYCMGVETILQCFLLDKTLQKKKGKQPKHCPEPLRDFVEYHSKQKG